MCRIQTGVLLKSMMLTCLIVLLSFSTLYARSTVDGKVKEGIVLAAFGTSIAEAKASFTSIEAAFHAKFANTPLVWTYTSQILRKKLRSQGEHIPSIAEALDTLAEQGVTDVRIQPLHVLQGEEYTELERAILLHVKKNHAFRHVYLGRPLMESREDAVCVANALRKRTAAKRTDGEALVLMGHGQEHGRAGLSFEGARATFTEIDPTIFMATVEGQRDFDTLQEELKRNNIQKVLLRPLMVVAGDHARNDLGGDDEDSWASKLRKQGFEVAVDLEGLGSLPEIDELYIQHALSSRDDLTQEPRKQ